MPAASSVRARCGFVGVVLLAVLSLPHAVAQAPAVAASPAATATPDELETLVGRIALYPDDLIAIVLPASTYPLQIVQADRFLAKRKTDPNAPVDEKWDDSIKSLLNYPEVVSSMSGDLDWTAALGEAVVADQGDVLDAIQTFRRKTQAAGNLNSDPKQVVVVEKEVIKIVPADPQVIYVPQYNPTTVVVYGSSPAWGYYPTPYPVYYYPYAPGAAFAAGLVWGAAISSAWRGHHYAAHYGGNANININRNINIGSGNINSGNSNFDRPAAHDNGSSRWTPDKQRGQVSRSVGATPPPRVGDPRLAGVSAVARPSTQPHAGGRTPTQPLAGSRTPARGGQLPGAGTGAFDGYGSGRQAQMDSARGAASRASVQRQTRQPMGGGRRSER